MAYKIGEKTPFVEIITVTGEPPCAVDGFVATSNTINKGDFLHLNATTRGLETATCSDGALICGIAAESVTNANTSTLVRTSYYPVNTRDMYVLNYYRNDKTVASISDVAGAASITIGTLVSLSRYVTASDPNNTTDTWTLNWAWTPIGATPTHATRMGRIVRLLEDGVSYYPRVAVKLEQGAFDMQSASLAASQVFGWG